MANPEIDHVDERRLSTFLEWMDDAHFEPTKFSGLENYKKDHELREKVMSLLENIYEEVLLMTIPSLLRKQLTFG